MTQYKVAGSRAYAGHQPGETFEADLTEEQERRALERGSLEIARKRSSKKTQDKEEEGDAETDRTEGLG
jgi:hypothetical protein